MTQTFTTSSLQDFVLKSRLVCAEKLDAVIARHPSAAEDSQRLGDILIAEGLLTDWQLKKLLAGKHTGFFLGEYKLMSHLARGGMSTLYRAEHRVNGRKRALKVLSPMKAGKSSFLPRFIREAEVAAKLRHRNIVRVYDLIQAKQGKADLHFIVMQLLNGRDLYRMVSEDGPLSIRESVDLIRQAANGLQHSHDAGLVHRDVKPGNLFLTDEGSLKVVDLGLAAVLENQDESLTRLCDERILGTADYLAPEQAIDSHRADHRADIYGLACTWYYLLCGHPPFNKGPLAQRILAHQTKDPVDIRELRPDVPDQLAELLKAMMVKRRALRVQTCADVAARLEKWLTRNIGDVQFDERPKPEAEEKRPTGRKLKRIVSKKAVAATEMPTDSIFGGDTRTNHELDSANVLTEAVEEGFDETARTDIGIDCRASEPLPEESDVPIVAAPISLLPAAPDDDGEVTAEQVTAVSRGHTAADFDAGTPSVPLLEEPLALVDRFGPPAVAAVAVASALVLATDVSVWRQTCHLLLNSW